MNTQTNIEREDERNKKNTQSHYNIFIAFDR